MEDALGGRRRLSVLAMGAIDFRQALGRYGDREFVVLHRDCVVAIPDPAYVRIVYYRHRWAGLVHRINDRFFDGFNSRISNILDL